MTTFTAKRKIGQYKLLADGVEFGSLEDCEVCWIFCSEDDELAEIVNDALAGDMSPSEMLPVVKRIYLSVWTGRRTEHQAELSAEGAWLRRAEHDPEACEEMAREDMRA